MSNYHCVLDASALLKKYRSEKGSEIVTCLFNRSDCAIHVLNVTIPEVTGAFVKWQLEGAIVGKDRAELLNLFISDIKEYNVVVHNITHRNVVATDSIWNNSITVKQPTGPYRTQEFKCQHCKKDINFKTKPFKPRTILLTTSDN